MKKTTKQDKIIELLEEINRKLDVVHYTPVPPYYPPSQNSEFEYYNCPRCHGRYLKGSWHAC